MDNSDSTFEHNNKTSINGLQQEWLLLQNQYHRFEQSSLLIKLLALSIVFLSFALSFSPWLVIIFIAMFWMQEAIWKTFQTRTQERLLLIESLMLDDNPPHEFQWHTFWSTNRPTSLQLIGEYCRHTAVPTIAFPYAVLIVVVLSITFYFG